MTRRPPSQDPMQILMGEMNNKPYRSSSSGYSSSSYSRTSEHPRNQHSNGGQRPEDFMGLDDNRSPYRQGGRVHAEAQKLKHMGRDGDTDLVHVNEEEKRMLKAMGGRGSINPETGLREYPRSRSRSVERGTQNSAANKLKQYADNYQAARKNKNEEDLMREYSSAEDSIARKAEEIARNRSRTPPKRYPDRSEGKRYGRGEYVEERNARADVQRERERKRAEREENAKIEYEKDYHPDPQKRLAQQARYYLKNRPNINKGQQQRLPVQQPALEEPVRNNRFLDTQQQQQRDSSSESMGAKPFRYLHPDLEQKHFRKLSPYKANLENSLTREQEVANFAASDDRMGQEGVHASTQFLLNKQARKGLNEAIKNSQESLRGHKGSVNYVPNAQKGEVVKYVDQRLGKNDDAGKKIIQYGDMPKIGLAHMIPGGDKMSEEEMMDYSPTKYKENVVPNHYDNRASKWGNPTVTIKK